MLRTYLTLLFIGCAIVMYSRDDEEKINNDLIEWSTKLPDEVDGVKIFRVNGNDSNGSATVVGFIDLPGIDKKKAFVGALMGINEAINPETDEIDAIDFDNMRFSVFRQIPDGSGKNALIYRYVTAYQFTDEMMTFSSFDINIEFKERGIIPRKLDIEKFKPSSNNRHKDIVESFHIANSKAINDIVNYINGNNDTEVTHWSDIKAGVVKKGMNATEVIMIGGKPSIVSPSGKRVQWIYSNDFIVIFTDGVVTNVIQ